MTPPASSSPPSAASPSSKTEALSTAASSSSNVSASSQRSSTSRGSPYPFAAAPDIIRSHQKDVYYTGHLANTLGDLLRRLLGARAAHTYAPETRTAAAALYFALTTLPGNRTLGEEYCDLVQLDATDGRLPSLPRRAAYIAGSVLLPYLASRAVPGLRARLRRLLERRIETLRQHQQHAAKRLGDGQPSPPSRQLRICDYLLRNLPALTSAAPAQAVTLAIFYFSGTYYQLTKRLLSLRYVFTRTVPDTPDRAGYELLGVLLVVQLAVQSYLHVRANLSPTPDAQRQRMGFDAGYTDVSLDHDGSYAANNELLLSSDLAGPNAQPSKVDIATTTHTPAATTPRFQLANDKTMAFIKGQQQRKCTLCLEELKDPAATQCGHVFCWECIGDWVREKPECPLCRRDALVQHVLPLRVM